MSSIPRAMCLAALIAASCAVGCTETIDVDPAVRSDRGADRLTLDFGLEPLDGAPADGAPQREVGPGPDGSADAAPDGQVADASADAADAGDVDAAADGSADAADASDVDAAADDRQNER